jgi:hypothetical protein
VIAIERINNNEVLKSVDSDKDLEPETKELVKLLEQEFGKLPIDENRCIDIHIMAATTGQLDKPNLLWRPGRASGDTTSLGHQMTPTPLAEELGSNTFEFGLVGTREFAENQMAVTAEKWLAPNVSYQLQQINLFVNRLDNKIWNIEFEDSLPKITKAETFLSCDPDMLISALYPAYTVKDAVVLRLANESDATQDITSFLKNGFQFTNALEEVQPVAGKLLIRPYEMATLLKKV